MATQTGIIGIKGTVGGLVFAKDGSIRQKPASNKASFQSSASMARTRENASEFGLAASSAKLIRMALRSQTASASDLRMVSRLTQKLREIIGLDTTNGRGSRVARAENSASLLGFNFNLGASLGQAFRAPYEVVADGATLSLSLPELNPGTDVVAPQGATHYKILYGAVSVNFAAASYQIGAVAAPLGIQPLGAPAETNVRIEAALPAAPTADELVIGVVGMDFYQELNGQMYPLNNNTKNPLAVAYVSAQPTVGGGGAGPGAVVFNTTVAGPDGSSQGVTLASTAGTSLGFNLLSTGGSAPADMDITVGGAQVASVAYLDRYNGKPFRFTQANGTVRNGVFGPVAAF